MTCAAHLLGDHTKRISELTSRDLEMLLLLGALQTSAWLVGGMAPVPATRGVARSSSSLRMAVEAEYDLVIVGCGGALPQHESCP